MLEKLIKSFLSENSYLLLEELRVHDNWDFRPEKNMFPYHITNKLHPTLVLWTGNGRFFLNFHDTENYKDIGLLDRLFLWSDVKKIVNTKFVDSDDKLKFVLMDLKARRKNNA